ncbi:MAG: dephospho-CoA kinase, partial [Cellvibrionales bacterium]|nr:dephospho-CoA kinase [Cellvibrionales bacterium]
MTFVVGLTGGIGSGKSTAGHYFEALGIEVINVDLISKNLVETDLDLHLKISGYFGKKSLLGDGSLNRLYIRHEIFNSSKKKMWLEELLHPPIKDRVLRSLRYSLSEYVILESPLLLETDQYKLTDRILVIDVSKEVQILRVQKRDRISADAIEAIITSQMPRMQKLKLANDV